MKIQSVLNSCEMQMVNQQSKQLRSEVLLSLLKVERENNKLMNKDNKTFTAVEMSDDMDRKEIIHELNYAILLLTDYQKTQSLSIAAPSNAFTTDFAAKLNSIKDSIEAILTKYQTGESE